jgi:hypothetical protein
MEVFMAAASGTWFAIFALIFMASGIFASRTESMIIGASLIVIGVGLTNFMFGVPIFESIMANPFNTLFGLLIYVSIGALYTAFWRWPRYIKLQRYNIEDRFIRWKSSNKGVFAEFLESYDYIQFTASRNKDRLASYVLMWPFSLTWELIQRPFIILHEIVYVYLGGAFDKIGKYYATKMHEKK